MVEVPPSAWEPVHRTPPGSVVVALGERTSEVGDAGPGLECAVAECIRTGRPLHLVHVVPLPGAETVAFTVLDQYLGNGRRVMDRAATQARMALRRSGVDDGPTGELVIGGSVVDGLVHRTRDAHLLVMQHDGRATRWFSRSRTCSVAGRSPVPVLSVPAALGTLSAHDGTTVAVQDPESCRPLLALALRSARTRGTALRVLHAWWLGDGQDASVLERPDAVRHAERARASLTRELAALDSSGVSVRVEVHHLPPDRAVVEAGSTSSLLVVGRRDRHLPLGGHLGNVARAAVDHATCPVLVAPEHRRRGPGSALSPRR